MFDVQTYLAAKSGKLPASPDMDMFSFLLGKSWVSPTKTITGVPPFTFKSNGDNLVDWSITGSDEVGKNLLNVTRYKAANIASIDRVDAMGGVIAATGAGQTYGSADYYNIPFEVGKTYVVTWINNVVNSQGGRLALRWRDAYSIIVSTAFNTLGMASLQFTITSDMGIRGVYISLMTNTNNTNVGSFDISELMLREVNTSPAFEPYAIGVGERTKNLVDLANVADRTASGVTFHVDAEAGTIIVTGDGSNTGQVLGNAAFLPAVTETTNLYMTGYDGDITGVVIYVWDRTTGARAKKWDGETSSSGVSSATREVEIQLLPGHEYTINFRVNAGFTSSGEILKPMLRLPDTNADFIPYGYEIPVTCGGTTTNVFIGDTPLAEDDTITKTGTGKNIPTTNGSNTLTVDTFVQPSEMSITYHR